ncbi:MAG: DUF5979 domain-containing protein [Atopobiaceae bacterium]
MQGVLLAAVLVFGLVASFTYAKADEDTTGSDAAATTESVSSTDSASTASEAVGVQGTQQSDEQSNEATASVASTDQSSNDSSQPQAAAVAATSNLSATLAAANGTSYDIYWYALIPGHDADGSGDANASWYGLGVGTVSGSNVRNPRYLSTGRVDLSGATISAVTPPSITYNGVTYQYAAPGSGNENTEGYYTLVDMRYVVADGANAGNNNYNPTASGHTYHFDHTLVLNSSDNYATVTFAVDYPDDNQGFVTEEGWSKRVKKNSALSSITQPSYDTPTDFTQTKTVNGVTYEFDGWYTDSACTQKADFSTGTVTGNMTFYGHYVAQTGNLTVSKHVAGSAANKNEEFTFQLTCSALAGNTYGGVAFDSNGVATFQLKDGESKTINGLPVGAHIDIRETGLSGNAKTSTTVSVDGHNADTVKDESSDAKSTDPETVTIAKGHTTTAAFTNTANAVPDNGISTNITPMVALAGAAAVGGVALAAASMRKRNGERKER